MEPFSALLSYVTGPFMVLVGYLAYSLRATQAKVDQLERGTMSEEQVRRLIDDKLDVIRSHHDVITGRINRLESKIDRLIDLLNGKST